MKILDIRAVHYKLHNKLRGVLLCCSNNFNYKWNTVYEDEIETQKNVGA